MDKYWFINDEKLVHNKTETQKCIFIALKANLNGLNVLACNSIWSVARTVKFLVTIYGSYVLNALKGPICTFASYYQLRY